MLRFADRWSAQGHVDAAVLERPRLALSPEHLVALAATVAQVLFAGVTTAYIAAGVWLEERDLRRAFGDTYDQYRRRVGPSVAPDGGDRPAGRPP